LKTSQAACHFEPKCGDLFDNPGNLSAIGSHFLPPERRL